MALDGCGVFCKYAIVVFNIIFVLVGVACLGLGLYLRFSDNTKAIFEIEALNSSAFVTGVTVMIVLGAVMLIVVMFGDYGACSEKRCALTVFAVLLAILALADIIIVVYAYSNKEEVGNKLAEFYTSIYTLYVAQGDPAIAASLIFINKMLNCCGVTGVPLVEKTCPNQSHRIMDSCPVVIINVFEKKAPMMFGIFFGTGALLIIAFICTVTLQKKIIQAISSPQYIILSQSTPTLPTFLPVQHQVVSTTLSDNEPVVFTPHCSHHVSGSCFMCSSPLVSS